MRPGESDCWQPVRLPIELSAITPTPQESSQAVSIAATWRKCPLRRSAITLSNISLQREHAQSRRSISSPFLGVFSVTAEGFCCGVDTLPEACLRGRTDRHQGLVSSAGTRSVTTESDGGTGGERLAPPLTPPGACGCNHRTPGRRRQAVPERRAARGPSTGSGAAAVPFQHARTATESNEPGVRT